MPRTIICLHGLGASGASFGALQRSSLGRVHRVLAPDLAGFGQRNEERPGPDPLHAATAKIVGRLRELEDGIVLVGHSMGSAVVLQAAATVPDRVAAVVLIEGNLVPEDCGLASRKLAEAGPDVAAVTAATESLLAGARRSQRESVKAWARDAEKVAPLVLHGYAAELVALSDDGTLLDLYNRASYRRAYLHGDGYLGHAVLPQLRGTAVRHIPGTGHFLMQDAPEATAVAIMETVPLLAA